MARCGDVRPRVTVITISFRDLPGLTKTIESTRAQDYPNIEHVVIDGGSGPETVAALADSGVAYWQSEPDGGRYDAMNQGIAHATGDLLWFMHSADVFASPGAVGAAVDALGGLQNPRASWGFGGALLIGGDRDGIVWSYPSFVRLRFRLGIAPIPHQAAIFGRDLVAEIGGYSTTFGLAADHLFMLMASRVAEPVVIPEVLCDFDTSGAGSVRPLRDHYRDIRAAWEPADAYPYRGHRMSMAMSYVVQAQAWAKLMVRRGLSRVT